MREVELKYRPALPSVLKNLSMSIRPGEKIGIVGRYGPAASDCVVIRLIWYRTGAGKSSIMTAIYRLVELTSGTITIDGVDISQVGLHDLRRGLAIIPQDPVSFVPCMYHCTN